MKIKIRPFSDRRPIKIKLGRPKSDLPGLKLKTTKSKKKTKKRKEITHKDAISIYDEYGLITEEASLVGIRALDYVKIESPRFVDSCEYIPSSLESMIDHFDLVWVLSVQSSYAEKRRWNEFIAFREFLQNSLDAMHESVGYENIKVDISTDNLGTWIMDKGKGLDYTAFMLGGKEKKCYLRGRYGEGLKVAALWFTSRNKDIDIYIFTKDTVFKCFYPKAGLLTIVFGKNKKYVDGTWILIKGYRVPSKDVRKLYYKLSDFYEVFQFNSEGYECPYQMPNLILEPGDSLYVRDIFVNKISNLFGTESYYSYNLWWVDLEPNRVQVQSTWDFHKALSGLLVNTPDIMDIVQRCMEAKEYGGIQYYLIHPRYYEMKVSFPEPPDIIASTIETKLRHDYGITAHSIPGDLDGVAAVAHEGGKCILAADNIRPIFSNIKKAADFVITSKEETLNGAARKDERMLDQFSRGTLRAWRLIAEFVNPEIKVVLISGDRAFYQAGTIYITEGNLYYLEINTFIHELAHALGAQIYKEAPDLSEYFEKALAKVGTSIYEMTMSIDDRNALKRAEEGAIFAEVFYKDDFFGIGLYDHYKANPHALEGIFQYPTMFVIIADSRINTHRLIRVTEKPVEEYYEKECKNKLKEYKEFIRDLLADRGRNEIDIQKRCEKIEFNISFAAYIRDKAEVVEIYYYDLLKDRYIFAERYTE